MNNTFLSHVFIFLAAASIIVPLASRFKLGSVLGYLCVGILIGPYGFQWIGNANQIMHFAEFGVIMMLFLIGLELEPEMLWRLRRIIVGLGSLQMLLTSACLTAIGVLLHYSWQTSLAIGMALSMSSTAIVLQMLQEKNMLRTVEGETSFAVLLFQDIAVIPVLLIIPLLAINAPAMAVAPNMLAQLPYWLHALVIVAAIGGLIAFGHFFAHHLFYLIAKANVREVFTATSLALVIGIALLMQWLGVSPALGAFVAGVVLANSDYKRTIEADIEPFKGLLLGLFFISVGMGVNLPLLQEQPVPILACVFIVIAVKFLLLLLLGKRFDLTVIQCWGFALALSQSGEFAFVLLQFAHDSNVIRQETVIFFTMVVALSMAATPLLMSLYQRVIIPRYISRLPPAKFDEIHENQDVILAGYGRFGQIIGRFLTGYGVKVTILEKDPEQIRLLRKFGYRGYFGDASRLDLMKNAGADRAKLLIVAIANPDISLKIVRQSRQAFPNLKIFSRARNRRHAYELHRAGVDYFKRETFDSSLAMAQEIMSVLGRDRDSLRRKARAFAQLDEQSLRQSFAFFEQEAEMIDFARQVNGELARILQEDLSRQK